MGKPPSLVGKPSSLVGKTSFSKENHFHIPRHLATSPCRTWRNGSKVAETVVVTAAAGRIPGEDASWQLSMVN